MRPPILFLTIAFGAGLFAGLDLFAVRGALYAVAPVLVTALWLARRAPLGAAVGIMAVAGALWGTAAGRERGATCAGTWGRESGNGKRETVAAAVRLLDPVSSQGGVVDADAVAGRCGGPVRLRWPEEHAARGGTEWVVAGRWGGVAGRGVRVGRRPVGLDPTPRGRGAGRGGAAAPSAGPV